MKNIISASRRTDIPAFYSEWFIERLRAGSVCIKNPYSGRVYNVSLKPEDTHSIVFWSKDFGPLIRRLEAIENFTKNLFFHFTITAVPKTIESNTPDPSYAIRDFVYLSKRYAPANLIWRFDPIVLTENIPFSHYEDEFARYSALLKGSAQECYISFVEPYRKVLKNFAEYTSEKVLNIPAGKKREYAERLSLIAGRNGIRLFACCNDFLLSERIYKGSCINGGKLSRLFNDFSVTSPPAPTRDGCGCTRSIDIGSYDTCPHGCVYCYANGDRKKAQDFLKGHNPRWNGLGFDVEGEAQKTTG